MKEVYFQSILIADLQKATARFQEFSKGLNIVTSVDNHVGKSSLLKALYYALGAEVDYDPVWDKNTKFQDEIKTPTTTITLTERGKLLCDSDYSNNEDYIVAISELLKNR